ncbi:hypothetical protein LWI29_020962 [Acer saccharum]|uniref:Uncharacterized protein n=1 Tax=Acer saccharum TaxID=4024 RepID=A0AA39W4C4_ACESA|nr:hypothetical protein LWI29_020962 [Acer saccharum]
MDFGGMILCFGKLVFTGRNDCILVIMKLNWWAETGMSLGDFNLVFMGVGESGLCIVVLSGIGVCGFHVCGGFEIDLVCVDGCVNGLKKMEVESDRDGWDVVKKIKMEVAEGDTCEEMVVNGIVGGHSTFEIRVLRHLGW